MRCPSALEIQSYIDNELMPVQTARVGKHLVHCRHCHDLARDITATAALLHTLAEISPEHGRRFTAPARAARPWYGRLRWALLPAAACLLLASLAGWRLLSPARGDKAFISTFVEAHRTLPAEEDMPKPCDFGLGGNWR